MFWQKKQEPPNTEPKPVPNTEPMVIGMWFVAERDLDFPTHPWRVISLLEDKDNRTNWKEFGVTTRENAELIVAALDFVQDALSSKEAAHVSE